MNDAASWISSACEVLGLQALEVRDGLTGYARYRFDSTATTTQRNLLDFAQNLQNDDLHTRMPDMVKTSGWNRRLKSHGKANQRLMTSVEVAERDADKRERQANRAALQALPLSVEQAEDKAEDEEPAAREDPFLPPSSTAPTRLPAPAPATLSATSIPPVQYSGAGRKRAATAKALEAEKPAKRGG